LAGPALPNCKSYHWWHNTRIQGKRSADTGKKEKEKEKAKGKTTLRNITVEPNVDMVLKSTHVWSEEGAGSCRHLEKMV